MIKYIEPPKIVPVDESLSVQNRMLEYQESRVRAETAWFSAVLTVAGRTVIIGAACEVAGGGLGALGQLALGNVLTVLGGLLLVSAAILASTAPFEADKSNFPVLGLDPLVEAHPFSWLLVCAVISVIGVAWGYSSFPYTPCGAGVVMFYALCLGKRVYGEYRDRRWTLRPSSCCAITIILAYFVWAPVLVYNGLYGFKLQGYMLSIGLQRAYVAAGTLRGILAIFMFISWLRFIKLSKSQVIINGESFEPIATKAVFNVAYAFFGFTGLSDFIEGPCDIVRGDTIRGYGTIAIGITWLLPLLPVLILGRKRSYQLLRHYFEDKQAVKDGAFVAELLDTFKAPTSGVWFVYRKIPDFEFEDDHRRFWIRGEIVPASVEGASTDRQHAESLAGITTTITVRVAKESTLATQWVEESAFEDVSVRMATGDKLSASGLLEMATAELRCIEWQVLDLLNGYFDYSSSPPFETGTRSGIDDRKHPRLWFS